MTRRLPHVMDPLALAAGCIAKLFDAELADPRPYDDAMDALRNQLRELDSGNLLQLEALLAAQVHVLHAVFSDAVKRYAGAPPEEKRIYGPMALKAQSYCRQSIQALARIKKSREYRAPAMQVPEEVKQAIMNAGKIRYPMENNGPRFAPEPLSPLQMEIREAKAREERLRAEQQAEVPSQAHVAQTHAPPGEPHTLPPEFNRAEIRMEKRLEEPI